MSWGVYTLNLGSWITLWRKMNFIWAEIIFRMGSLSQSSMALLLMSTGYLYKRLKVNCEHGNSVMSCITRSRQVCFWYFHEFSFLFLVCVFNLLFLFNLACCYSFQWWLFMFSPVWNSSWVPILWTSLITLLSKSEWSIHVDPISCLRDK